MWDFFWIKRDRERDELWKRANEALFNARIAEICQRQEQIEKKHRPFYWDAGPDLAQAAWEWPKRVVESASTVDWPHDFAERLCHQDPLWAEIKRSKGRGRVVRYEMNGLRNWAADPQSVSP
jgi:hypothetical protein